MNVAKPGAVPRLCLDRGMAPRDNRAGSQCRARGAQVRRRRMIEQADVVVIGAGAFGASVAFHLARSGDRRVALVERHAVASQTSPRAAGLTSKARGTDLMMRLADLAVRKIERFTDETGEPLVYHQV